MSLEILPYSTPTGIRHYVPLEDYQRAIDNLDKLENENMAMREAIKEASFQISAFLGFYSDSLSLPQMRSLRECINKLQSFLTESKQHEQTKHQH